MTLEAHDIAIKTWLEMVTHYTGGSVFQARQNGNRPNTGYATFDLLSSVTDEHGLEEMEKEPAPGDKFANLKITLRDRLTYQLDIYSEDGDFLLKKLWMSRAVRETRAVLKLGGLTLSRKSIVRNLKALQDTQWLPRSSCDFVFLGETSLNTKDDLTALVSLWNEFKLTGTWKAKKDLSVVIENKEIT